MLTDMKQENDHKQVIKLIILQIYPNALGCCSVGFAIRRVNLEALVVSSHFPNSSCILAIRTMASKLSSLTALRHFECGNYTHLDWLSGFTRNDFVYDCIY